jgi:hypothetical protein
MGLESHSAHMHFEKKTSSGWAQTHDKIESASFCANAKCPTCASNPSRWSFGVFESHLESSHENKTKKKKLPFATIF